MKQQTTYTIYCNWKNWRNGGLIERLTTSQRFTDRAVATREANAMQTADRDTGEYNTAYVVDALEQ